ncbi:SMI1 / KNR4 family protein [Novipirellula aureliae]|uniref:SMI1 / KNR4 family protein n=1 Tax=Novipirellula aureliae TaxID=2527966 RepID=A0A5C6E4X8_9BACT|nr:SMI1/KNR4 family protein [Novipirellula aureliae]TWU43992.1 SMI1 / KNR4 family protein [Novipirellula aureliae]
MTNWPDLLTRHHAAAQADSGYEPIFGDPASPESIADVESKIGLPLPAELKDLYLRVDGYGLQMEPESMISPWFIVPTSEISDFVSAHRGTFADTHRSLSDRFIPFIDWANGDSMGYIYDRDGNLIDGLHMFMHELYRYDPEQEPDEFIRSFEGSLADFLEP